MKDEPPPRTTTGRAAFNAYIAERRARDPDEAITLQWEDLWPESQAEWDAFAMNGESPE